MEGRDIGTKSSGEGSPLGRRPQKGPEATPVGGLMRGLAVLEAVAAAGQPMPPSDLIPILGLPKATVYRLCRTMEQEGFLRREFGGKRLIPGPRLDALTRSVLGGAGSGTLRHAILRSLSEQVGETCNIAIPDGSEMNYFDRVETDWPLRLQLPVGTRVPLHCTASGKLYLSTLSPSVRSRLIRRRPLARRAPNTLCDPDALEQDLARIRETGVGTDDEEFLPGMVALAVPILDPQGRMYGALAIHAPVLRLTFKAIQAHIPAMRQAAAELSRAEMSDEATGRTPA